MIIFRKSKKSGMQTLIIMGVISLVFLLYSRNTSEVNTYVDHKGKEQFQIIVTKDLSVESNPTWITEKTKEASSSEGLYVYLKKELREGIYFYIADSDRTYDFVLDKQPGSDTEVIVLETGELSLKKDTENKRVFGNIHFSQLGYGAYLNMSEKTYQKQEARIMNILKSYQLLEE